LAFSTTNLLKGGKAMKSLKVFCAVIVFFTNAFAQEERIDENLKPIIASINSTEFLDVIIELKEQSNFDDRHLTRAQVVSELMQLADRSQVPIRQFLEQKRVHGSVESFKPTISSTVFGSDAKNQ